MKKKLLSVLALLLATITNAQTWMQQTSGTVSNLNAVSFVNTTHGFVCGANNTVLKTVDGGSNWSTITTATSVISLNFRDVYFINNTTGWLLADLGIVLKTTDAGATWIQCNTSNITPGATWEKMHFGDANNGYITGIESFSVLVSKTTDGGATWSNVPFTTTVSAITGLQALGSNSVMISADRNVYYSSNGGATWVASGTITPASSLLGELKALDFDKAYVTNRTNSNNVVYKSNLYSVWNSNSNGLSNGGYDNIDAFDANNVMVSKFNGGTVFKTNDGGLNWIQETLPTTLFVNDLKYITSSTAWVVGSGGTILAYGSSVGMKEELLNREFNIYPNPVKDALTIETFNSDDAITLTDVFGKIVYSIRISGNKIVIDLSTLNNGVYYITVGSTRKKIIKV